MTDNNSASGSIPHDAATAPNHPSMSGTDLLLLLRGSSGITVEHVERLLDIALAAVPAPPLHDTSRAAVNQWLRDAQDGLWSRREQRWLARQVAQILFDEWSTADWVERTQRAVRHREAIEQAKRAGIHWAAKESRRSAQRPARLRLWDETWNRHRVAARLADATLGQHLGLIMTAEAQRASAGGEPLQADIDLFESARFIRVDVDEENWTQLKAAAARSGTTMTVYISQAIEQARRPPRPHRQR